MLYGTTSCGQNGPVRFLKQQPPYDLTYSDVFMVPSRSGVSSRLSVDLTSTDGIGTTLPLVVAKVVGKVKASHPVFDTAVSVTPGTTVGEAMSLLPKRAHGAVVVVEDGEPVGTVTDTDAAGVDRFAQVREVMSTDLLCVPPDTSPTEIFESLTSGHLNLALVVEGGRLLGVLTRKHALRSTLYRPALDAQGGLMIGAAVGINGDVAGRAKGLLDAGIDVLVVDTAHGHQERMLQTLKSVREVRDLLSDTQGRVPIVAGNVVSAEGVIDLIDAGADVIKVGVGP